MHLRGALRGPFACRSAPVGLGVAVSRLRAAAGLSPLTAGGDDALREPGMRASLLGAARRGALRARPVQQLQPLAAYSTAITAAFIVLSLIGIGWTALHAWNRR